MIKKYISLALACAVLLCPVGRLAHAAANEETVRMIAELFAEQEKKTNKKLNLEESKRQKLEDENKALLEELQKLKASQKNKDLQQELEKMKKNKTQGPSVWSAIKTWFRNITGVVLGVIGAGGAILGIGAGAAGIWTVGSAVYDCHADRWCESFTEKMSTDRFMSSFGSIKSFVLELMKNIHIHTVFVKDTDK